MNLRPKLGMFHIKRVYVLTVIFSTIILISVFVNHDNKQSIFTKHVQSIPGMATFPNDFPVNTTHMNSRQKKYCSVHGEKAIHTEMWKNIVYNDKYKVVYCSVPKVACTNWQRMFLIMSGKMNTTNPMDIKSPHVHSKYQKFLTSLADLSKEEISYRLKHYYKFVFTRDPFERVLSAYMNKFKAKNPYFHGRYGKKIVQRYRLGNKKSSGSGNDVTFPEFVDYLTDFTRKEQFNGHWERITEMCHPCLVKYDFVGSMDNMDTDADYVLDVIGASGIVKFPKRSDRYKHASPKTKIQEYYGQITPAKLNQLLEVYYPDLLMFNLTLPKALRQLTNWKVKF